MNFEELTTKGKWVIVSLTLFLIILVTAAVTGFTVRVMLQDDAQAVETSETVNEEVAKPDVDELYPAPSGTEVPEQRDGPLSFEVVSAQVATDFTHPLVGFMEEGTNAYVVVEVTNNSDTPIAPNLYDTVLYDNEDRSYAVYTVYSDAMSDVNPGQTQEIVVLFGVGEDADLDRVEFSQYDETTFEQFAPESLNL